VLVLSRRVEESVRIGNDIEIKILETGCNQVKLGITAPANVPIWRTELLRQGTTNEIPSVHFTKYEPLEY